MLISLAAMLMVPAGIEEKPGDDFAQCAYVAATRSKADTYSQSERKEWAVKAGHYIGKALALAYPGKTTTDDELAALGVRAQTLLNEALKDVDGDEAEIAVSTLLMTCEV